MFEQRTIKVVIFCMEEVHRVAIPAVGRHHLFLEQFQFTAPKWDCARPKLRIDLEAGLKWNNNMA